MPKVSVVIASYNRARFIGECIESVLSQSFRDFEILVVDDGSEDNTREVVSTYCPRVKYFHQVNQGAPAAYNRGIEVARGEYVAFLDSDDALTEDALRMGVDVLNRWPDVGISYGQSYVIDEYSHVKGLRKPPYDRESYVRSGKEEIKRLILGNYITSSTTMIRRICFEVVGLFDNRFRSGSEDFDMWIRLLRKYDVAYIDRPLAKYRVHNSTLSAGRQVEDVKWAHGLILKAVFNDVERGNLYHSLKESAYYHFYCRLARIAISKGDAKTARNYLVKALKTSPMAPFWLDSADWPSLWAKTVLPTSFINFGRRAKRHLGRLTGRSSRRFPEQELSGDIP